MHWIDAHWYDYHWVDAHWYGAEGFEVTQPFRWTSIDVDPMLGAGRIECESRVAGDVTAEPRFGIRRIED